MRRLRPLLSASVGAALAVTALQWGDSCPPPPPPAVVVYEDGSGVQYAGDTEVRTFPEGTFVWDCRRMGNRICG